MPNLCVRNNNTGHNLHRTLRFPIAPSAGEFPNTTPEGGSRLQFLGEVLRDGSGESVPFADCITTGQIVLS